MMLKMSETINLPFQQVLCIYQGLGQPIFIDFSADCISAICVGCVSKMFWVLSAWSFPEEGFSFLPSLETFSLGFSLGYSMQL
ncbi:hypothetical protein XENTR_v10002845 [Xenopus tropicalis]|nr:hypothetical protein XENTR_v10002845 [Xenopus tropicalis]